MLLHVRIGSNWMFGIECALGDLGPIASAMMARGLAVDGTAVKVPRKGHVDF